MATAEVQGSADRSAMNLTAMEQGLVRKYDALREVKGMVKVLEEQKREVLRQEMQERKKQKQEQRAKQQQAEQSEMDEVKKKLQKGWEGTMAKTEFKRRGGDTRTSQPGALPSHKQKPAGEYDEFGILITPPAPKAVPPPDQRQGNPPAASPPAKKPRPAPAPAPAPKQAPAPVAPAAGRGTGRAPPPPVDNKPIGVKRQAPSVTNKAPKLANPYPTLDEMAVLRMKAKQAPGLFSVPTRKRKALTGAQAEAAAILAKKAAEHSTLMPVPKAVVKPPPAAPAEAGKPDGGASQAQKPQALPATAPDKSSDAGPAPQPVRTAISTDKLPSILEASPAGVRPAPAAPPVAVKVEIKAVARSALMDEDEDEDYD